MWPLYHPRQLTVNDWTHHTIRKRKHGAGRRREVNVGLRLGTTEARRRHARQPVADTRDGWIHLDR